jgi:hypothetical protein
MVVLVESGPRTFWRRGVAATDVAVRELFFASRGSNLVRLSCCFGIAGNQNESAVIPIVLPDCSHRQAEPITYDR